MTICSWTLGRWIADVDRQGMWLKSKQGGGLGVEKVSKTRRELLCRWNNLGGVSLLRGAAFSFSTFTVYFIFKFKYSQ